MMSLPGFAPSAQAQIKRYELAYAPAPVDNPLKGLVPYAGEGKSGFPHSLEFNYLPLSKLLTGPRMYEWKPMETLLNEIAGRGNQAVFRIYTEYPGQKDGLPPYLLGQGVKTFLYPDDDSPTSSVKIITPDYNNPILRKALQDFILELGRRYDGDPRIGFITAGLLGKWGEWHDYPREDLFAKKKVQLEIMEAYEKAFHKTPILLRYPAGESDATYGSNAKRNFGYHDDSFAWATLDTGKPGDNWYFVPKLKLAGQAALDKWKSAPIGGEIRPEAWGKVFDAIPGNLAIQDFDNCVRQTHVSWLMDSGMFNSNSSPERVKRAKAAARRMGYEFTVTNVSVNLVNKGFLEVATEISNRGVAPFYYDWTPEFMLVEVGTGKSRKVLGVGKLRGLLPESPSRTWHDSLNVSDLPAGTYSLFLRISNPLANGKPIRFANQSQDSLKPGWLTLVPILHFEVQK